MGARLSSRRACTAVCAADTPPADGSVYASPALPLALRMCQHAVRLAHPPSHGLPPRGLLTWAEKAASTSARIHLSSARRCIRSTPPHTTARQRGRRQRHRLWSLFLRGNRMPSCMFAIRRPLPRRAQDARPRWGPPPLKRGQRGPQQSGCSSSSFCE